MQVGASIITTSLFPVFSSKTALPHTALKEVDSNLLKALASRSENYEQINVQNINLSQCRNVFSCTVFSREFLSGVSLHLRTISQIQLKNGILAGVKISCEMQKKGPTGSRQDVRTQRELLSLYERTRQLRREKSVPGTLANLMGGRGCSWGKKMYFELQQL